MSTAPTFLWHDYETTGADPRRDRPVQFAGVRTDADLRPVADPVVAYCKPAHDVLPQPDAVMLTGITPQHAEREGVPEPAFAALVRDELGAPGTCGVGFNSIRFDDEITRNLLYRNFHDPYAREWERGNSRWDLIDLARMCYALRPDGIEWPRNDEGAPSFKLEQLARANRLAQSRAHDALSDVEATLELARLIRRLQPRLFEWHFALRNKRRAMDLLDWQQRTPVLHISSRYPAQRGCIAMVMPLAALPEQPNAVVVYDLYDDPTELLTLDVESLRDRVFTARADLPDDTPRVPLKLVRANRSPALAPLSVLQGVDLTRIALDPQRCERHAQQLRGDADVAAKVRTLFSEGARTPAADPELAIYDGFLAESDRGLLPQVRRAPASDLQTLQARFRDPRYRELLFRYRARHHAETLDSGERLRWAETWRRRLQRDDGVPSIALDAFRARVRTLRSDHAGAGDKLALLDQLDAWADQVMAELDVFA